MQVYDVRLLVFFQLCYVLAGESYVYGVEIVTSAAVGKEYGGAFSDERPCLSLYPSLAADRHGCPDTAFRQCLPQSRGCYRCASRFLVCAKYQYSHRQ